MLDMPHAYSLKPALAEIVGTQTATRQNIISALWEYIKAHKLQDKEKKNLINCDATLRGIFKQDTILIDMISLCLKEHLTSLEPLKIEFNFKKGKKLKFLKFQFFGVLRKF